MKLHPGAGKEELRKLHPCPVELPGGGRTDIYIYIYIYIIYIDRRRRSQSDIEANKMDMRRVVEERQVDRLRPFLTRRIFCLFSYSLSSRVRRNSQSFPF